MGWFRSNRREAAWLALFALACQFVFSFGHVHLGRLRGVTTWADSGDAGHDLSVFPTSPRKHPTELPAHSCAICANIALSGTLLLPDLAIVLAPRFFVRIQSRAVLATEPAGFDRLTFEARGPPNA